MNPDTRKDIKFFTSLLLGFALALLGCLLPPAGTIENSMLWLVFAFLMLSACIEGVDIKGIIHEIRLMKESTIRDALYNSSETDRYNSVENAPEDNLDARRG